MLEDMLRTCVMEFKGSWDTHLAPMEFAYNKSHQASIDMAPFEALYDRKCGDLQYEIGDQVFFKDLTLEVCVEIWETRQA